MSVATQSSLMPVSSSALCSRLTSRQAEADEVFHDLGLSVDDDRSAAREVAQRYAMTLAIELELDAVVDDPLAPEPLSRACVDEQIGDRLLEHAGANALLDVLPAAVLEHDRLDAFAVEQLGEREPRRAGAHDPDLRAHQGEPSGSVSSSTSCAILNAPFAAGTPQ